MANREQAERRPRLGGLEGRHEASPSEGEAGRADGDAAKPGLVKRVAIVGVGFAAATGAALVFWRKKSDDDCRRSFDATAPVLPPLDRGPRSVRARQAGRGGAARARPRARRQARVERRAVRAVPRRARGAGALRARAEPLSRRRRLGVARRARRAPRRALRAGRDRRGRRRRHRLPEPGRARRGRRDRLRLAVVPELRPRRDQARRAAGPRPAARPPLRPRRAARRDHAAHEARLRLPPEQPDGNDEHARRAGQRSSTRSRGTC